MEFITGTIWQNPGSSDIYDRATKDAQWLTLQSNGVVRDLEAYVPASTLVNTTDTTAAAPQLEIGAANWFEIVTNNAKFIVLQFQSKVTNVTGGGTLTISSAPLRIFGYGLLADDEDPDFAYPVAPANAIVGGVLDTAIGRGNNLSLLRAVATDSLQGSSNLALSGELDLSLSGLVQSTNLATNTNLRNSWDYIITNRHSGRVIATALDNDLLTQMTPLPYEKIFFQIHTGLTSAAPANQVDTLRIKAKLKLKLGF